MAASAKFFAGPITKRAPDKVLEAKHWAREGSHLVNHVAAVLARLGVLKGLWHFLAVREDRRADVEIARARLEADLEKEHDRNRTFADHRDNLPAGAELVDYEDGEGRKLWIRKPSPVSPGPSAAFPPPMVVELGPGAVTQIPAAGDRPAGELGS